MAATIVRPVVSGVDGSDGGWQAVKCAAEQAASLQVPLRIVHAFVWPLLHIPSAVWRMGPPGGLRAYAEQLLADAEGHARSVAPDVPVTTALVKDFPLPLLVDESRTASYVVVGTSGLGAVADTLAGSLTIQLVARSHAPVVVVRGTQHSEESVRVIMAGFDGSPLGMAAMKVAAEEAARRHGQLVVAHVVRVRGGRAERLDSPTHRPATLRHLDEALKDMQTMYPGLPIEERVLTGHPGGALVEQSGEADRVVVGSRGLGGFTGMMLGSVSQALLHHAQCPVIVVSPRASERLVHDEQTHTPTHGRVTEDGGPSHPGDEVGGGSTEQGGAS